MKKTEKKPQKTPNKPRNPQPPSLGLGVEEFLRKGFSFSLRFLAWAGPALAATAQVAP